MNICNQILGQQFIKY